MDGTLNASDVALLTDRNNNYDMWGGNSMMWIFALLILAGGGFGGLGNNGFASALGYQNLATQNDVQRGFDNLGLENQTRDILAATTDGTAQSVAATNQARYDNINVMKDIQNEIDREIGEIQSAQASALANQNQCCCNTLRAIDGVNYNLATHAADINSNTTAQVQKVLDALSANKIEALQNQINQLQLNNAVAGVVRYPMSSSYFAGPSPFFAPGPNPTIL